MINIFQMNDWEISKFLKVILAIQIILLVFIGLDALGVHIPLVREFVALIYLTYIPGILILRILRLHELGNIETLLYAVGLSIASVMIIGFLMNLIYPVLGISNPISISYLLITISIFVLILCVFSYIRDKTFADPDFIDIDLLSPTFLVLCVVPFLAIFGTYVMNFYNRAHLNGLLIGVIGLIAILFAFNKIPKRLYPFAVF
ncbi:MAG: hypothetical protein FJ150_11025, partial [Euryarchaeota archaeon]|nr:hypothetical protein [Euryarchaeota archaeon]